MTKLKHPAIAASHGWLLREIVATLALSGPIVATNLAVNFMSTTDVMILGWLSPEALAAGALGQNLYMPVFLFCVGVIGALAPIAASLVGSDASDTQGLRRTFQQALISVVLLALPVWALLWNARAILLAIGEPSDLAERVEAYMHGLQWALAPALLYFSARSAFAALGRTAPILIAGLIAVGFNALANYALVFGHFGAPKWGLFGSGIATTLSQSLMLLILAAYSALDPHLRRYRLFAGVPRFDARAFAQLWRLGLPIGATIAAEISIFAAAGLVMGLIGPIQLEAHAIVLQIAATAFMIPLGLGQAASVRVAHAFGARDPRGVSRAGWVAFLVTIAYVALSALTMLAIPRLLVAPFIADDAPGAEEIVPLALAFLRIAAIFQLFDGAQAALTNMLRGVHDSRWPMMMALVGYWAIGAPIGLALAFLTPLRGLGLWIGLACGLAAVSLQLLWRWRRKERGGFA
ncbi:MAG TPA: MATE family efflux transporter [Roseiarcus sp.]|jgi:MATE family multidrug resistance protein